MNHCGIKDLLLVVMHSSYLIEIRMFGKAKHEIRDLVLQTSRQFNIQITRPVPHITLVGGFTTDNETRLIRDFKSICRNTGLIGYVIEGIDAFRDTGVVYLDVHPSGELIAFRRDLKDRLRKYCKLSGWDFAEPFEFHTTIAMHQPPETVRSIIKTIRHNQEYHHLTLRATLLKNGKILCEYDFLLKRLLSRQEALSKQVYEETMNLLSEVNFSKTPAHKMSIFRKIRSLLSNY